MSLRTENRTEYENRILSAGFSAASEKLKENRHKESVHGLYDLLMLLRDEVGELMEAIQEGERQEIRREAGDVINFACMIADEVNDG